MRSGRLARPARGELALAALLLLAVGAGAFGSHVLHGGFYWDDWENAASSRYPPAEGFALGGLELSLFAYRPVHALGLWVPHEIFGPSPTLHLALGLFMAVLASAALYLLLRTFRVEWLPAAAIAVLVLIFPWSDSGRLWATASINNLAIALYLLGTVIALRGLELDGREARRHTACALALYVLSVLTYEVTAAPALLSLFLYATRVPWRLALRRWRLDVAVVLGALAVVAASTTRVLLTPLGQLEHALKIADQSLTLLASAGAPFGSPPRGAVIGAMLVVVACAVLALHLGRLEEATRATLRRWLVLAGASAVAVLAGYAAFVPGEPEYVPLSPGAGNRVNVFAAIGFTGLVVSLTVLGATLAVALVGRRRVWSTGLTAAVTLAIAVGYLSRLEDDKADWERSAALQEDVLGAVAASSSRVSAGTTIYTFGEDLYAAPGVPVFAVIHDLNGAVKLTLRDGTLSAFPTHPDGHFVCGTSSLRPVDPIGERTRPASYGEALFVDVAGRRSAAIATRAQCKRQSARFAAAGREALLARR